MGWTPTCATGMPGMEETSCFCMLGAPYEVEHPSCEAIWHPQRSTSTQNRAGRLILGGRGEWGGQGANPHLCSAAGANASALVQARASHNSSSPAAHHEALLQHVAQGVPGQRGHLGTTGAPSCGTEHEQGLAQSLYGRTQRGTGGAGSQEGTASSQFAGGQPGRGTQHLQSQGSRLLALP